MDLEVIVTPAASAQANMEKDKELLFSLEQHPRFILHLYDWEKPSLTYGCFAKPEDHLNLEALSRHGLDFAQRATGGGIVFHVADLAFSVLVPEGHKGFSKNTLSNYAFVNDKVKAALMHFLRRQKGAEFCKIEPLEPRACHSFCMAKPTKYDVMIEGKKAAGAAQRTKRFGYLHQGTISLGELDPRFLADVLKSEKDVLEAMQRYTFAPLGKEWQTGLKAAREKLRSMLIQEFQR